MDIDLSRFRETFFQEAAEHTAGMEAGLLGLADRPADEETLNAIFRGAHSIKAGAGTFGFEAVARFTHQLESLLDDLRSGKVSISSPLIDLLLRAVDFLKELLDAAARGDVEAHSEAMNPILDALGAARGSPGPGRQAPGESATGSAAPQSRREYLITFEPHPELFRMGLDPFLVLRDLSALGTVVKVEADLSRLPPLAILDPETCYLGWKLRLASSAGLPEVRDVFAFVEDLATVSVQLSPAVAEPALAAVGKASRRSSHESSIRVSTEKVDHLIDLVGELVIAQSMATQIMNTFRPDMLARLREAVADMERFTRELQERVMSIRMLPIGTIFSRFPRLVHDVAASLEKQVTLEVSGEDTELDKGVVEQIADPLTHLVRNAVDHGIELPEQRRQAGKPAEGTVRLSAYHQGGNVIVEVTDDGRGLDLERIRQKGVDRGLIAAGEELSEDQVAALIFRPGFSTAQVVSDLSGRGVGMDVVRKGVEALNGSVTFSSRPGEGSCFRVKLPLTLAVLDGLLLKVGSQTYVLPLVSIAESIQPGREQVRDVAGRGEVIVVRKDPLPLLRLHRLFGVPDAITDPSRGLAVIVEHEGRHLALLVDELVGQQQVVIKSLETHFRKVEGIMGATILGDGHAALILDIAGIVEMSRCGRGLQAA